MYDLAPHGFFVHRSRCSRWTIYSGVWELKKQKDKIILIVWLR